MSTVQTVLGPIDAQELGGTMSHTHLTINLLCWHEPPDSGALRRLSESEITLQNYGMVRRNPTLFKDNLLHDDLEQSLVEIGEYKAAGGQALVCNDLEGMGRDITAQQKISRATGLHIVASTGYYVATSHPPEVAEKPVEELTEIMVREITEGIGATGVKAGNIGEIGMSGAPHEPYHPDELKALVAGARAQRETGISLTVHPNMGLAPGTDPSQHLETYVDVLEKEGADLSRFFMSHMDMMSERNFEAAQRMIQRGVGFLSYDCFGHEEMMETAYGAGQGFPPDKEGVKIVLDLLEAGHADRILMSAEVAFKSQYKSCGGWGYSHLYENIIPWLLSFGASKDEIHQIMVENPSRLHGIGD